MKNSLIAFAILSTTSILPAQVPNAQAPPSATTPKPSPLKGAAAIKPIKLLDPAERVNWKEGGGEWKFDGTTLTGTGDSSITYARSFKAPFRITFDFEMVEGSRPRIRGLGRYSLANEGGGTLALYPKAQKAEGFNYKLGRKCRVRIDITKESVQFRANNRLIDTRMPGVEVIPPIRFSSGDSYSPGIARFSNIEITAEPAE